MPKKMKSTVILIDKAIKKDMNDFIRCMDDQLIRLDEHHINYHIPMPEWNLNYMEFTDLLRLPFTTNRLVKVVYTVDGPNLTVHSRTYKESILIIKTTILKLRSILSQGKLSAIRTINLTKVKLLAAVTVTNSQKELQLRYIKHGYCLRVNQLQNVKQSEDTSVTQPNDFFCLVPINQSGFFLVPTNQSQGASIFTGYLYLAHSGLPRLRCATNELIVNNHLLINNNGNIKRSVPTDVTVPFQTGYHPIKMIVLNNIWGGFHASGADFQIKLIEWESSNNSGELVPAPVFIN
jgi:hexosaminidase